MKNTQLIFAFFVLQIVFFIIPLNVSGQDSVKCKTGVFYIEPEFISGRIVANHSKFPESDNSKSFTLNIGKFNNSSTLRWASFYNYPFTGVSLRYSNLGNDTVFGNEYTVMPYIIFNTANRLNNSIYFKLGLGCSYFSKHYNSTENPTNKEIGSGFTWSFQSFIYYSLFVTKYASVNIGAGYMHSSNGHIQLPNFGLNQGAISLTARFFPSGIDPKFCPKNSRIETNRDKVYYIMARGGAGIHEYGSANGPIGGPKRLVESFTLSAGTLFRHHIKFDAGFTGRFYQHYYYQILNPEDSTYSDRPRLNASNLYFLLGCEFIAGHIGIDIEGGLNLYKPYFRKHYTTMEGDIDTDYWLKQLFNSKLGLNYYFLNPANNPRINFFLGANINANFGQADFSEICFGTVYSFN